MEKNKQVNEIDVWIWHTLKFIEIDIHYANATTCDLTLLLKYFHNTLSLIAMKIGPYSYIRQ